MDLAQDQNVVGVRFSKVGKVYHFDASRLQGVRPGDSVVVETARGWQLGEVAQVVDPKTHKVEGDLKSVSRLATARDLLLHKLWQVRELDVVTAAKKRAEDLRLNNIKIVLAEYSFDGSRLAILFSSESEDKVDLKSLRQDMQKLYAPAQVELRQIGPRDVAKVLGGMGACGLEKRCCSAFLTDFSSISIRMAKEQGISLSPSEITGMCGRLRCCLIYEYETYAELRKGLPKRGKRITTPAGEGKVIDVSPLTGKVRVDIAEVGVREFTREELDGTGQAEPGFTEILEPDLEGVEGGLEEKPRTEPRREDRPRPEQRRRDDTGRQGPSQESEVPSGEAKPSGSHRPGGRPGRRRRGGRRN